MTLPLARSAAALAATCVWLGTVGIFPTAAQEPAGTIRGSVVDAETDSPIPLSLVRLLGEDEAGEVLRGTITDDEGRFHFEALPQGVYHVQMDRIGFERTTSEPLPIGPAASVEYLLRSPTRPIELAGITVGPGAICYTAETIGEDPELATLWREAQTAVETRRAFSQQYRYTYRLVQRGEIQRRLIGAQPIQVDSIVRSEPEAHRLVEAERAAERRAEGFGTQSRRSLNLTVPADMELLDESFLVDHCFDDLLREGDAWGIRFRPVASHRNQIEIRGTIWIDAVGYAVRALEFDFVRNAGVVAETRIEYADVAVPGGTVRLPSAGIVSGSPEGTLGRLVTHFHAEIDFLDFGNFERTN